MAAFIPSGSSNIAYFEDSASISVEDENQVFDVVSLEACASWKDNVELIITGDRKPKQIYTSFWETQLIELYWKDIDMFKFESSGGTAQPGADGVFAAQI